jgi:hypothetical protein
VSMRPAMMPEPWPLDTRLIGESCDRRRGGWRQSRSSGSPTAVLPRRPSNERRFVLCVVSRSRTYVWNVRAVG